MKNFYQRIGLLLVMVFIPFRATVIGCGYYWDPDESYYNLFDQLLIKEAGLRPFLLTMSPDFYTAVEDVEADENMNAWIKYTQNNKEFKSFTYQDFSKMVYQLKADELPHLTSTQGQQIITYLTYAKKLEPYTQRAEMWDTEEDTTPNDLVYQALIKEGIQRYQSVKDAELKLRYGYQLVRLARYQEEYDEALSLFDSFVTPVTQAHVIYYYALEQKAGVLYQLGQKAEANYLFCKVFDRSNNRKRAAYSSIHLQGEVDWDQTYQLCKTPKEKAALYAIRGCNSFSNELQEAENILEVCPESPYMELLAIRYINKMERKMLDIFSFGTYANKEKPNAETQAEYLRAKQTISRIATHRAVLRKEFWQTYLAHLAFLFRDYEFCEQTLNSIYTFDETLLRQISRTRFNLYLTTLQHLGRKEEDAIQQQLQSNGADVEFIKEITAHLYKQQQQYAQAFLVHNTINALHRNPDLTQINALIKAYETKEHIFLTVQPDSITPQENLIALYELKGTHYLRMRQFKEAEKWYARVPDSYKMFNEKYVPSTGEYVALDANDYDGYSGISPLIFSNGFKRWFDYPAEKELVDNTYTQSHFKYLNKIHNKKTLVEALSRLQKESTVRSEQGALAAYLLSNYYFNISSKGYYRNIPTYFSNNGFDSMCYPSGEDKLFSIPDFSQQYNFKDFTSKVMLTNPIKQAITGYEWVLQNSSNDELIAKATYMLASCMKDLYLSQDDYWSDEDKLKEEMNKKKVHTYYDKLINQYSNTKFFKEAVSECKDFEWYTKNQYHSYLIR